MKKHLLKAVLSIALLFSGSHAFAESADVVPLPISGVVMAEKSGVVKIASQNGRFEFKGVLYDRWSDREVLTMDDARRAFNYIEFDALNLDMVSQLEPYQLGTGDKQVMIFMDPYCPACHKLLEDIPRNSTEFTFNIVPIGVLGEDSIKRVMNLTCAKDQKAAFDQLLSKKFEDLEVIDECSMELTTRRMFTAQIIGIKGIPFLIRQDGLVSRGAPQLGIDAWLNG